MVGEPAFVLPEHVLARDVEGQTVLVNLDNEAWFGLDVVGADVVERVTSVAFPDALEALRAEYEVDAEQLRTDVDRLLRQLLDAGLLAEVSAHEAGG